MAVMHDNAARREHARQAAGQFGAQEHSAPEVSVPPRVAGAAASARTVRTRTLRLGVPVTRRGWFGRTRVEQVPVDVRVHETSADATVNDPDRGERIYLGQAHRPITRNGAPAPADDIALGQIAVEHTADIDSADAAGAAQQARERLRDLLVIDVRIWARASRARAFSS
jgi:hypothetical protein